MLKTSVVNIVLVLAFGSFLLGQKVSNDQARTAKQRRVQALREQIKDIDKVVKAGEFGTIQMALAKEGEREQLQQLICELDFGVPVVQNNALRKLRHVGGWFSINAVSRFLGPNPKYRQRQSDKYGLYGTLQVGALLVLPHMVPNAPLGEVNPIVEDHSKDIKAWNKWLAENRQSLMQLQPIGQGITSSWGLCSDVLRHDPESTKYAQNP